MKTYSFLWHVILLDGPMLFTRLHLRVHLVMCCYFIFWFNVMCTVETSTYWLKQLKNVTYSPIQQIFVEYLICARHWYRQWRATFEWRYKWVWEWGMWVSGRTIKPKEQVLGLWGRNVLDVFRDEQKGQFRGMEGREEERREEGQELYWEKSWETLREFTYYH